MYRLSYTGSSWTFTQVEHAEVVKVTQTAGGTPGTCQLALHFTDWDNDLTSPGAGIQFGWTEIQPFTRMAVKTSGTFGSTLFVGDVRKRHDVATGVLLELADDRWSTAAGNPLRGAIVADDEDEVGKWIDRVPFHFNPKGFANCHYDNGWQGGEGNPPALFHFQRVRTPTGNTAFWTPRTALQYLSYWLNEYTYDAAITGAPEIDLRRTTLDVTKLDSMLDAELDANLPDTDCEGKNLCEVLDMLCKASGVLLWGVTYGDDGTTTIELFERFPAVYNDLDSPNLQPDYDIEIDATATRTRALAIGAVPAIEADLRFTATLEGQEGDTSEIAPVSAAGDRQAFLDIIHGDGTYAVVDGVTYGPSGPIQISANSDAAVGLARQFAPLPYFSFRVQQANIEYILEGQDDDETPSLPGYEVCVRWSRPLLPRQLTKQDGSDTPYPVRARTTGTGGQESQADNGYKTGQDQDGAWFGFRGLTDDQGSEPARIYSGKMTATNSSATASAGDPGALKDFAVNAAMEHDLRVVSQYTLGDSDPWGLATKIDSAAPPRQAERLNQTRRYDLQVNSAYKPGSVDVTATFGIVVDDRTLLDTDAAALVKEECRLRCAARLPISEGNETVAIFLAFAPGAGVGTLTMPGTANSKVLNACVTRAEYTHKTHTTVLMLEGF